MAIKTIATNGGVSAIASAIAGQQLTFTKIVVGDGFNTEDPKARTALSNQLFEIDVCEFKNNGDGTVDVIGTLTNAQTATGFYYREIGLFARLGTDDSVDPVLIAYGNGGLEVEFIPAWTNTDDSSSASSSDSDSSEADTTTTLIEKKIVFKIIIGQAANVSADVNSQVYTTKAYVDENDELALSTAKEYTDTKDETAVHKTDDETIDGNKTFNKTIINDSTAYRRMLIGKFNGTPDALPTTDDVSIINLIEYKEAETGHEPVVSWLYGSRSTSGHIQTVLATRSYVDGVAKEAFIASGVSVNGVPMAFCTQTPSNATTGEIATASFVNTKVNDKVQLVATLPASPVAGVLYCIPE